MGRKLEAQAREPSSKLRQGMITCRILGLAVKGFVSTPTEHGASQTQVGVTQMNTTEEHVLMYLLTFVYGLRYEGILLVQQPPVVSAALVQARPEARSTLVDGGEDIVQEKLHAEHKLPRKEHSRLVIVPSLSMYS